LQPGELEEFVAKAILGCLPGKEKSTTWQFHSTKLGQQTILTADGKKTEENLNRIKLETLGIGNKSLPKASSLGRKLQREGLYCKT
jgi:hypothetical protein